MEEVTAGNKDILLTIKCVKHGEADSQPFLRCILVNAYNVPGVLWDAVRSMNMVGKGFLFQGAHSLVYHTQVQVTT